MGGAGRSAGGPVRGTGVAHRVDDERREIGALVRERPSGVEARQEQQVLDHAGHALGLGLDAPQGVTGVGSGHLPSAACQFGVTADRGERRTQLVAGVRDELAHPCLALLAGVQGRTDVTQHPVEGGTDLADLGTRIGLGLRNPFEQSHLPTVQGEFGDPGRRGGHPAQRAQRHADHGGTGDAGGDEPGPGDADLDDDQGVDGLVHLGRGDADEDGRGAAVRHGLHAVTAQPRKFDVAGLSARGHPGGVEYGRLRARQRLGGLLGPRAAGPFHHLRPGEGAVGDDRPERVERLAPAHADEVQRLPLLRNTRGDLAAPRRARLGHAGDVVQLARRASRTCTRGRRSR